MFGVSLPNTEHQLAFLQHQYQQLQQENMFYQACIKNQQQQLEELKAKKKCICSFHCETQAQL
jgi:hypothetical protein